MLGEVTERIFEADEDEDEAGNVLEKKSEMLFVRGDSVVMIARMDR